MIDYLKQEWFRISVKRDSNNVYESIGISFLRMDELSEKVAYLFGKCERTSQVIEIASGFCKNNKELLAVGMMINSVVYESIKREQQNAKRLDFLEKNKKPTAVFEFEDSPELHTALGISQERSVEIFNSCKKFIVEDQMSFTLGMEEVSKTLIHPNELVLACQLCNLIYKS